MRRLRDDESHTSGRGKTDIREMKKLAQKQQRHPCDVREGNRMAAL
jgi:hypothetical protein